MDSVIRELKYKRQIYNNEEDLFKNKVKYYSVMDELKQELIKGRIKPSNIYNRRRYGYFYKFIQYLGY